MHVRRRIEERAGERERLAAMTVARESEPDERVVVRPDRAVVIRSRVIAALAAIDGAHAPAGEEIGIEQSLHDARRALGRANAGEEQLARVRRSEEHTSELQSRFDIVCRLLLEKKKK